MKNFDWLSMFKLPRRSVVSLVVLLAALAPLALFLAAGCASDSASTAEKPAVRMAAADTSAKKTTPAPRKLSGAELYSMNCNRCHQERYPTERTAAQWRTILLHMRVRANLPDEQARTILQYLQDNSGR
jgi:mono/diheme cytochrome c family protein